MTGQDFQDKLDAIVADLQTNGKNQTVNIMFRNDANAPTVFPLSSDASGVVNAAQLDAIESFLSDILPIADSYAATYAPVQTASEAFRLAQTPHEALIEAARLARATLNDALANDPAYQAARAGLDNARKDPAYVTASEQYRGWNVSENFSELTSAKGKYVV